jgi:hypothetical protein
MPNFKTAAAGSALVDSQTDLSGGGEGLSFAHTLQELSETNPNAAALLLALQQSEVASQLPLSLQAGGSGLPVLTDSGGNLLPQPQLQSFQLNHLPLDELPMLDARQLQPLVAETPVLERGQLFAEMLRSGLATEGLQTLEARGLSDIGSQLQGFGLNPQTAAPATSVQRAMPTLPLQLPVGQSGWDNAVGERIQWMMSRNVQQAEIKLTPPELGPMEIKISLQNDQTHVQFVANHSATRDALESAIPRLRELFGEINLNLADVDVNQGNTGGAFAGEDTSDADEGPRNRAAAEGYDLQQEHAPTRVLLQSRGLLDAYV